MAYNTDYDKKNERLQQLKNFMQQNPEIIGMTYFNTDFTNGMTKRTPGEADRAIINTENNKIYYGIYDLIVNETQQDFEKTKNLFSISKKEKTTYFTEKQKNDLANLMIEKFGKKETLRRINGILDYTENKNLQELLKDLLKIIEKN